MPEFIINPEARNPAYPRALVLKEVYPNTQFVTVDTGSGAITVVTVAENWRTIKRPVAIDIRDEKTLISVPELVTQDVHGRTLSLSRRGIHPFLGNGKWREDRFSVLAEGEDIIRLCLWLEQEGYPRSARKLRGDFVDFFGIDWNELLAPHA